MDASESSRLSDGIDAPLWMFWKRRRYIVVLMAFLGFLNMYTTRANLSVAIVAMTENRTVVQPDGSVIQIQEFDWSSTVQGYVLSSFFYGYLVAHLPAGILANKFGATNMIGTGIGVTSVLALLTPLAARAGVGYLIATRILQGMSQGVINPCMHTVWSRWAPPSERSRMVLLAFAGVFVGTILAMLLSGVIASAWRWEGVFYIFGACSFVWFVAWFLFIRKSPEEDRFITPMEKRFILQSLGCVEGHQKIKHPWKGILTSKAVYAIIIANFCQNWGFYNMLTQLPSFLKDAFKFSVQTSGFVAAIPYFAMALTLSLAGYLADWFQIKGILTTTQVRRNFTCGSFLTQAIFMVTGVLLLETVPTVACITIAIAMGAFAWSGYAVNQLDLSPKSAGLLAGMSNSLGTVGGIVSPIVTGYLTKNHTGEEWTTVFYILSGIYLFGVVVYWFCASGELQPWSIEMQERREKQGYENKASVQDYTRSFYSRIT
ncbi:hypothetical protein pipiens_017698 [Culex pipiens pipiens]|uniref:Sialin n=1 Tax=Culex pipiens pipiens TaxID=38569 RepID=A0ABD1CFD6_CULPP